MSKWTEQAEDEMSNFRRVSKQTVTGLVGEISSLQAQCEVYREALEWLLRSSGCVGTFLEGSACDKAYKALNQTKE